MTARIHSLRGVVLLALAAAPAVAQADTWAATGDVRMRYRTAENDNPLARAAATIPQTLESDRIYQVTVGGTNLGTDDDPGTLSLTGVGTEEESRDLGEVAVRFGTLDLTDSFVRTSRGNIGVLAGGTLNVIFSSVESSVGVGGSMGASQSFVSANVQSGGTFTGVMISGSVSSEFGARVIVDTASLNSGALRGDVDVTNATLTGVQGHCRDGLIEIGSSIIDVGTGTYAVGRDTSTSPSGISLADTTVIWTETQVDSGIGLVGSNQVFGTFFEMRSGSLWRSSDFFRVSNPLTEMDVNSGSRLDLGADFNLSGGNVTVRSGAGASSRIDVSGNSAIGVVSTAATLTIEDGGYVDIDGTLTIGSNGTLDLNGGTLRVGALDDAFGGLNENGGTLIVPEAGGVAAPIAAALALAGLRRRRE